MVVFSGGGSGGQEGLFWGGSLRNIFPPKVFKCKSAGFNLLAISVSSFKIFNQ